MNGVDVLIEIGFIAHHVLPKPALPGIAFCGALPPLAERDIVPVRVIHPVIDSFVCLYVQYI